jgi:hypothetical protein
MFIIWVFKKQNNLFIYLAILLTQLPTYLENIMQLQKFFGGEILLNGNFIFQISKKLVFFEISCCQNFFKNLF